MSKKTIEIIGFIAAIIAVIIATTPVFNLAIAPIIIAFISGLIVVYLSKKENTKSKTIQYIFLLVIIALGLTLYKTVFNTPEVNNSEQLKQQDIDSVEDANKALKYKEIGKEI